MISAFDKTYKLDLILSAIDWLTFNVVLIMCGILHVWPFYTGREQLLIDVVISNIAYLLAQQFVAITLHHRQSSMSTVLRNSSKTAVTYAVLNAAILGMSHFTVPGIFRSAVMAFMVFLVVATERMILRNIIKRNRSLSTNRVNTIIIGSSGMAQNVVNVMTTPWNGYNLLGFFDNNADNALKDLTNGADIPRLGRIEDIVEFVNNNDISEIYIDLDHYDLHTLKNILAVCEKRIIRVFFIPIANYKGIRQTYVRDFGDIYVMAQYNEPLRDVRNRIKKRLFDIAVSLLFLCTVFPFVLIIVAIISKITMPGPLFFKQTRTGYDGRNFKCYKFRSMKVNKDSDKVQACKGDPRITKWGSFMRHANIDELPQFINVLKGDMSLVGPRPHMLAHTDYYSALISDYMVRHYVKPGITGWAQTQGERGETKTVQDMERRVIKDIWYIEHWSFWLDIQIMIKTITDAIHGDEKAF